MRLLLLLDQRREERVKQTWNITAENIHRSVDMHPGNQVTVALCTTEASCDWNRGPTVTRVSCSGAETSH